MNTSRAAALGTLVLSVAGLVAATPASAAGTAATTSGAQPNAALQPIAAGPALAGLTGAVPSVVRPAKDFRLDPLANSAADPLNNGVALKPDHGAPVSTAPVTSGLSNGGGLGSLPVIGGAAAGLLPG
ncbi:hypothetical protein [Streptacidiphilus jiangxiensis]|uniref:ATP-binding protein n=1 Tax=Streptacidiphilus jiangxiensis TaxID=235985 RepID=A0A1H7Q3N6_STRJI|nr:hypothetical protein [Streptacidiphilus jiangxiensis]SEL42751.1 hypothetical protein SAMN05414137_108280 [Streptacidiphilus jiangxiensis]